ncbi:HEAT repeat domain-containing protein [Paraliobacillus sp. X-1268]|uniref:HEAT repeat domain-containing protein n=1 Tax=Paraliobacillus sp. X-1268 TaxID=2213193 RepID=UPI000E3D7B8F|nr:HEAT repeat domain-containing protein [Paraliobacillus sp. X-1268]
MLSGELFALSVLTVFIFVLLTFLLGYLLIRKARENRSRKRIKQYKENYKASVYDYLVTGDSSRLLRPSGKERKLAIEELLSDFSNVLEGEDEKKNLSNYATLYLTETYRSYLKSRQWSKRMNTLFLIEDLYMDGLAEDVKKNIVDHPRVTKEEVVQALSILARFKNPELYYYIDLKSEQLLEFDLRTILRRVEDDEFNVFLDNFKKEAPALQYAVVEKIGNSKDIESISFLESIYQEYKGEIKIRALKAIVKIGYVNDITDYLPLCESSSWQERMLVARLLKIEQDQRSQNCLKKLLHDESWWVRSQAGESLASFQDGFEILTTITQESQDAYARDMANEWLNKGVIT